MEFIPLPNLDSEQSDNDQGSQASDLALDTYVLRITPHDKFNFDQIEEFLKAEPLICKYVIGRELVPREHFHVVCQVDISVEEQEIRDIVKAFLIPFWVLDTGKLPRGFGNKQYNLQISTDLDSAVSYAVKQQEYRYDGFEPDYIESRRLQSFEKKKPKDFQAELHVLRETFMSTDMGLNHFMSHFVNLKAKYDQQVLLSQAYGYALSITIKRDGNADYYVNNYLAKQ